MSEKYPSIFKYLNQFYGLDTAWKPLRGDLTTYFETFDTAKQKWNNTTKLNDVKQGY